MDGGIKLFLTIQAPLSCHANILCPFPMVFLHLTASQKDPRFLEFTFLNTINSENAVGNSKGIYPRTKICGFNQ